MPYALPLLRKLQKAGWKVRIFDNERLEPPHITILFKNRKWRLALRSGKFLDNGHQWSQINKEVRAAIDNAWQQLQAEWDLMYSNNPVGSQENDDE